MEEKEKNKYVKHAFLYFFPFFLATFYLFIFFYFAIWKICPFPSLPDKGMANRAKSQPWKKKVAKYLSFL